MQPEKIKCNHIEAVNYAGKLKRDEKDTEHKLSVIKGSLRKLNGLIKNNDDGKRSWVIDLPVEILLRKSAPDGVKKTINWKKLVMEMINKYNMPMSSDLLYHKLIMNYEDIPVNRHFVIKNISAALHYLEAMDDKLFRI